MGTSFLERWRVACRFPTRPAGKRRGLLRRQSTGEEDDQVKSSRHCALALAHRLVSCRPLAPLLAVVSLGD